MTRRRCHIAALFSALALVVALACLIASPQTIAAAAGFGVVGAVLVGEVWS